MTTSEDRATDWVAEWYAEHLDDLFPDIDFEGDCRYCDAEWIILHDTGERECYWCGGLQ